MKRKWIYFGSAALMVAVIIVLMLQFWPTKDGILPAEPDSERFRARIIECYDGSVLVQPESQNMCDKISFSTRELENIGADVGDLVEISFSGEVMESYPAQIIPFSWTMIEDVP